MKTLIFISMFLCDILYAQQSQDSLKTLNSSIEKPKSEEAYFKNAISLEVLIGRGSANDVQPANITYERVLDSKVSVSTYFSYMGLSSGNSKYSPALSMTGNFISDPGDVKFELSAGGGFFFSDITIIDSDFGSKYKAKETIKMPFGRLGIGFLDRGSPNSNKLTKLLGFAPTTRLNFTSLILLGESEIYFVPMIGLSFGVSF